MQPLENDDPSSIGPYRLVARLGAGGMGRVYLARSAGGRTVAVKVVRAELADNPDFRARFRREVAAAQSVDGAYTAPVVDADRDSATPWLATAYVLGPSLNEAVAGYGPLPEHSVRALGAVLAEALGAIHGAGLIHRDLKPSNVLLSADGPRVIDFGIARALDGGNLTSTGVVVGSPGFMSPEQASGKPVGPEGDIFSLGSVLAFAATGHGPFGQDSAASLLYRVVHDTPDLEAVPASLREAIHACLAKDPAERPTPEALLALLAPDGAAGLLRGSWLPAEVASGIAQHAARVMEMETPAPFNPPPNADPRMDPRTAAGQDAGGGTVILGGRTGEQQLQGAQAGFGPAPAFQNGQPGLGAPGMPGMPGANGANGATPSGSAPSRRGLIYGAVGVAVAAAVGGTAVALSGGDKPKPKPPVSPSGSASPTTYPSRPAGVAPTPVWTYPASQSMGSLPIVSNGVLLVADESLTALDPRSGKVKWQGPTVSAGYYESPMSVAAGLAVVLNGGNLEAYDLVTGAKKWALETPMAYAFDSLLGVNSQQAFLFGEQFKLDSHGMAIINMNDETNKVVISVDLHTQKVGWVQHRKANAGWDVMGFVTEKYLVYTNDKNNVVVRDAASGTQLWSQDFGDPKWTNTEMPILGDDTLYLPGPNLLGFGLDKGNATFKLPNTSGGGGYGQVCYADGTLYMYGGNTEVIAVDAKSGKQLWTSDVNAPLTSAPLCAVGPTVFAPVQAGADGQHSGVAALDRTNGHVLWTFQDTLNSDDWWMTTDGTLLYVGHDSRVYALPPR